MKKFTEVDAQIRAAIDLMESAGILNEIKAMAIEEFKSYVESGLRVLNEPSWERKRKILIDEKTYLEITLSEFDDYADKLRKGEKHGK